MTTQKIVGRAINNQEDNRYANCPSCDRYLERSGFYDSSELCECDNCGREFLVGKVWLSEDEYIE